MTAIRLALVDDHPLFREGVRRSLSEVGFEVVGEGSSRDDAVRLVHEHKPDIVLMDISMPGGGLGAIDPILERSPGQSIVMLTVSETASDVTQALGKGVSGYVLKGVGSRALAEILRSIARGERYVSPALSARVLSDLSNGSTQSDLTSTLTDRESEILILVATGLSNKRIAIQMSVHEKTVKHHMTRIMAKLKVSNRTEAAMALRDSAHYPRRSQATAPA